VQLAHLAGATVTGALSSPARADQLAAFRWLQAALIEEVTGPHDLIIDLVGGDALSQALTVIDTDGTVVTLAQTAPETATVPMFWFGQHPGARLVSVVNGQEQWRTGLGSATSA
jgi:NADPH:quinone reductase-like Zn-dependent oxidoreductase